MEMPYFWQHRYNHVWSQKYDDPTMLFTHQDDYFEDYLIMKVNEGCADFMLRTCGYRSCSPNYRIINRIIDRYCIHVILSGKAWVDGVAVYPGSIIFFERNRIHNFSADPNDPCRYAWITFKYANSESLLKELGFSKQNCVYYTEHLQQISAEFYDMMYTPHKDVNLRIYMESCMLRILALAQPSVQEQLLTPEESSYSSHSEYIDTALQYIKDNLNHDIRVEEISAAVGLNDKYFRSLFKKTVGMSPHRYLTQQRVEIAATLLKSSNYTVSEISEFVGFRDYREFSYLFKKRTGLSPSAFRSGNQKLV